MIPHTYLMCVMMLLVVRQRMVVSCCLVMVMVLVVVVVMGSEAVDGAGGGTVDEAFETAEVSKGRRRRRRGHGLSSSVVVVVRMWMVVTGDPSMVNVSVVDHRCRGWGTSNPEAGVHQTGSCGSGGAKHVHGDPVLGEAVKIALITPPAFLDGGLKSLHTVLMLLF